MKVAIVRAALVRVSPRSWPKVFTIPFLGVFLSNRPLGINLNQLFRIAGVFMKKSHCFPGFAVFDDGVVINDVVEGLSEFCSPQTFG